MADNKQIQASVLQAPRGLKAGTLRKVAHRLTKRIAYCPTGSRYVTRNNVRDLFLGKTKYIIVRNDGSQRFPKQGRPFLAHITSTRLRIGCHVWSGADFKLLKIWALGK